MAPAEEQTAFLSVPQGTDLDLLLARHEERTACGDATISFEGKKYRLQDRQGREKLLVRHKAVTVVQQLRAMRALVDGKAYALVSVTPSQSSG